MWSPYQENMLLFLRNQRKIQKWTQISRILSDQYQIKGRNGKQCKQKFQQRFNPSDFSSKWTFDDQKQLFSLHNQLGNKWAIISRKMPGKSDNCVKNHFYSKLRKGLKKMNEIAQQKLGKSYKELKFAVIFKIIEATQDGFKDNKFCDQNISKLCFEIKNKLIYLSYDQNDQHEYHPQLIDGLQIYQKITQFSRNYKRKPKKFRRIPSKPNLSQKLLHIIPSQSQSSIQSSIQSLIKSSICQQKQQNPMQLNPKSFKLTNKPKKCQKRRRQSAQTVGISQIYMDLKIDQENIQQQPQLFKKRTSFIMDNQEFWKYNMFLDQSEINHQRLNFQGFMSLKRISHIDLNEIQ